MIPSFIWTYLNSFKSLFKFLPFVIIHLNQSIFIDSSSFIHILNITSHHSSWANHQVVVLLTLLSWVFVHCHVYVNLHTHFKYIELLPLALTFLGGANLVYQKWTTFTFWFTNSSLEISGSPSWTFHINILFYQNV